MSGLIVAGAGLVALHITLNLRQAHAASSKEKKEISNKNSVSEESVTAWLHGKEGDAAKQRASGSSLDTHHNEQRYIACDELDLELLITSSGSALVLLRSSDGCESAQPRLVGQNSICLEGLRLPEGEFLLSSKYSQPVRFSVIVAESNGHRILRLAIK